MIAFLKETLRSKRTLFIGATGMTVLVKVSVLIPALLLGKIIDTFSTSPQVDATYSFFLLIMLCVATALQSIFHPLQTYQLVKLVQIILKEKSVLWTARILQKEFEQFSSLRLGGLIKSLERGITAHEKFLTFVITAGLPLIIELALSAAIFTCIGGVIIFFALLGASVVYMLIYRCLVNWRRPFLMAVNELEDAVSSRLFETFQAGKIIKLEQACDQAPEQLYASYAGYAQAATKVASTGALLGAVKILYLGLSVAGLLAWGVYDQLSVSPRLTVGDLVAVFSIAGMLLNNFSALAEAYRALDQFRVDKEKLEKTLLLDDVITCSQQSVLRHLSSLSLSRVEGVTDKLLRFQSDQSVAIIGPSGGGKTTLLETLAGTLRSKRQHLSANDLPLHPSGIEEYLSRVRYCPQSPVFLEGYIRQSVFFGYEISSLAASAIESLELHELAKSTYIAEGAKNISGGEAKRLSLLRLINRPGDFNLFDEPTASLDQETGVRVWEILFTHFQHKGLICATHDLAALPFFDRVIVMKQGSVIADGVWSDLEGDLRVLDVLNEVVPSE